MISSLSTTSRKLQRTSQQEAMNSDSPHSHQQAWMDLQTGDSRPTLLTSRSTSSIRMTELSPLMLSRELILIITRQSGISTLTTAHAILRNLLIRPAMTPEMNSLPEKLYSFRMVPGSGAML